MVAVFAALSWMFRAAAIPSFDPFSDASANGGTGYQNQSPLYHQRNALGESWVEWNGGTTTSAIICTNLGLTYGGFPIGFPTPVSTASVYLPGQVDHAGGISGLSAALTRRWQPIQCNLRTNRIYACFCCRCRISAI